MKCPRMIVKEAISDKAKKNWRIAGAGLLGIGAIGAGVKYGPKVYHKVLRKYRGLRNPDSTADMLTAFRKNEVTRGNKIDDIISFRKGKGLIDIEAGGHINSERTLRKALGSYNDKFLNKAHSSILSGTSVWDSLDNMSIEKAIKDTSLRTSLKNLNKKII